MSYRIRFTLPDGRTGLWTPTYATREEAQRAIRERQEETGLAYVVEEVVTPEARILELEAEIAAMSLRLDGLALLGNRLHEVLALELSCYEPTNPRLPMLSKRLRDWESVRDRMEFERQGKPNVIEAELAQLRDAYDAARQDLDVAKRKASSANTRLDCALTRGNRLRNVMSMLTSPDEDTRLLVHAAADEWDEFLRITTDSRASEAPKDTP